MSAHVIYARKSSESEDRQVLSIDSQIHELRSIAARRGVAVKDVLTEMKSAKAPGRPVFGQLMRRVGKGEIHTILCWKMDRLARNHLDTGLILQSLADGKLTEVITSDRTYTRDGNDRFMGNFELSMATKFIDDLSANTKRGNRARFQQGWVNHNPPLGYLLDPATKTIVKDPLRFPLVRQMFEMILSGTKRPSEVIRIANEEWGFRTRKWKRIGDRPLAASVFFRMIGDPFFMGIIRLRSGETFAGAHPPMLTHEEFERIQEIMRRPGRIRPQRHTFAFTGLITCGECGGAVTAEKHVKKSQRCYVYYRCSRRRADVVCREPAIPDRELEAQFQLALLSVGMEDNVRAWMVKQVKRDTQRDQKRSADVREAMESALGAIRRELENLLSLRLRDLVTDDAFMARKREIEERQRSLEAKLRAPTRAEDEVRALAVRTINFASRAAVFFENGTPVQQRAILESVGLNYSLRARKVAFSFRNPWQTLAAASMNSTWGTCAEDIRTWIQDTTEYFAIPNLEDVCVPKTLSDRNSG